MAGNHCRDSRGHHPPIQAATNRDVLIERGTRWKSRKAWSGSQRYRFRIHFLNGRRPLLPLVRLSPSILGPRADCGTVYGGCGLLLTAGQGTRRAFVSLAGHTSAAHRRHGDRSGRINRAVRRERSRHVSLCLCDSRQIFDIRQASFSYRRMLSSQAVVSGR